MLGLIRKLVGTEAAAEPAARQAAPSRVEVAGSPAFGLEARLKDREDFPVLDWDAVHDWLESMPEAARGDAWLACERGWLLHLRDALGPAFQLHEGPTALVLSSLDARQGRLAIEFMERTLKRIRHVLRGIAGEAEWGKDILVLFDDEEQYYRYVSRYHPDSGEFALSGGMFITSGGCHHFVSTRRDFSTLEPTIAHEMTHGAVAHLPIPLWLNEGLAVNTERRVAPGGSPLHTPREMRAKHLKFWRAAEIAQFWSGESFHRPDEGNELSYDLARVLVEQLSADWTGFVAFVNAASHEDGGFAAAREHLGVDLDAVVRALLTPQAGELEPDEALAETEPTFK